MFLLLDGPQHGTEGLIRGNHPTGVHLDVHPAVPDRLLVRRVLLAHRLDDGFHVGRQRPNGGGRSLAVEEIHQLQVGVGLEPCF